MPFWTFKFLIFSSNLPIYWPTWDILTSRYFNYYFFQIYNCILYIIDIGHQVVFNFGGNIGNTYNLFTSGLVLMSLDGRCLKGISGQQTKFITIKQYLSNKMKRLSVINKSPCNKKFNVQMPSGKYFLVSTAFDLMYYNAITLIFELINFSVRLTLLNS